MDLRFYVVVVRARTSIKRKANSCRGGGLPGMKVVAKSIVVFCMLVAGCMAADAEAPDQVSSWMLVLSTPNAVVVAPTTYDTHDECLALLEVATSGSPFLGQCIPARLSPTAVEAFVAKRTQAEAEYAEKAEQLARDRSW